MSFLPLDLEDLELLAADALELLDAADASSLAPSCPASERQAGASAGGPSSERASMEVARAQRLQRRAMGSRRLRRRKKSEMTALREQVAALDARLALLCASRAHSYGPESQIAVVAAQRLRRQQAEQLNQQLKRALFEHRALLHGLRGVLSASPLAGSGASLVHVLHTPVHLGTHPRARLTALQSVCSASRLDLALDVVDRETAGEAPTKALSISNEQLKTSPSECAIRTVAVFALETSDVHRVFCDARSAIVGTVGATADDRGPRIRYAVSDDTLAIDEGSGEAVRITWRLTSCDRVTDDYALLLWDFVDADELNPIRADVHIKCDVVGVLVARREVCADGVERVVCRYVCAKLHRLQRLTASGRLARALVSGDRRCTLRIVRQVQAAA